MTYAANLNDFTYENSGQRESNPLSTFRVVAQFSTQPCARLRVTREDANQRVCTIRAELRSSTVRNCPKSCSVFLRGLFFARRRRRVYREVFCVLPLLRKSHCHLVGARRGSMVAHHIREAGSAGGAGGISKPPTVGNCHDHSSIAENDDAACSRPGPSETRCIYSPHHSPTAGEHDVFSG